MGSRCTCQYSTRLRYRFNLCRAIPKFRAISVLGLNENRRIIEELTRILPLSSFSAAKSIIVYLAVPSCSTRLQNEWLQPQKCFFWRWFGKGTFSGSSWPLLLPRLRVKSSLCHMCQPKRVVQGFQRILSILL